MGKDPAVLFYPGDFMVGTFSMTMEERGQYITLLCLQHQKGRLTARDLAMVGNPGVEVLGKFEQDENGLWFNKRMEDEAAKRANFTESRRNNLKKNPKNPTHMETHMEEHMETHMEEHMETHMETHMENENEKRNRNEIKGKGVKGKRDPEIQVAEILHPFSEILKDCPNVRKLKNQLTPEQSEKLIHEFGFDQTREILLQMENHRGLVAKYQSVHLTALNWLKRANQSKTTNNNNHVEHPNSIKPGKVDFETAIRRF